MISEKPINYILVQIIILGKQTSIIRFLLYRGYIAWRFGMIPRYLSWRSRLIRLFLMSIKSIPRCGFSILCILSNGIFNRSLWWILFELMLLLIIRRFLINLNWLFFLFLISLQLLLLLLLLLLIKISLLIPCF